MQRNPFYALLRRIAREEEGVSLIYLALSLMVLIGISALAIDGANAYLNQREMQTAADSAALAAARALALETGGATVEAQNMAAANGASHADLSMTSAQSISVRANENVPTYLAGVLGVNDIDVAAEAEARFEPVVALDKLLPVAFEGCDCFDMGRKTVAVDMPLTYCPSGRLRPDDGEERTWKDAYAFALHGIDPAMPPGSRLPERMFSGTTAATFVERSDGTAQFRGRIINMEGNGFDVDLTFGGRTNITPPGSPKMPGYSADIDSWYYYPRLAGTMTGLAGTRYEGAVLSISEHPVSMQIGGGASTYLPNQMSFASWMVIDVTTQPTNGYVLNSHSNWSDLIAYLEPCPANQTVSTSVGAIPSDACGFKWLDWNGSPSSYSELASALREPESSGVVRIGDRIATGPRTDNVLELATALEELVEYSNTVVLYDEEDDGEVLVCGFAEFELREFELTQFPRLLDGVFVPAVRRAVATDIEGPDFGVRDVVLIR